MSQKSTYTLVALGLLGALPAAAEQETAAVVVTATRQATRSDELISDVSVVSREEIEQAGVSSLAELLARQPGIQYVANGGAGATSSILIRGAAGNQSIVLVDGLRIGSATTGSPALSRIPLDQVERIEILRGPASSLYGADAIGGVVQIFTRRGDGAARVNASTGYGSNHASDTSVGFSGGSDVVSYSVQAGYLSTDGFNAINDRANSSYNPDRDGYTNQNFSANFALRPAAGQEIGVNLLSSQGRNQYDSNDYSARGAAKDYRSDQAVASSSVYTRNRLSDAWTSTLRAGRSTDDASESADGIRTDVFRTDIDQLSWQNDVKLPLGKALLALESARQKVSGTTSYAVSERTINSLLGGWSAVLDEHSVQLNVRRDDNSQFGTRTTGAAAYGYQFDDVWRAHAAYGTAFRAPTFNELYYPANAYSGGGNPDLKPETAQNAELGVNWELGGARAAAVFYHNRVHDLIEYRPPAYVPVNVSQALLRGMTLSYDDAFAEWGWGGAIDLLDPRNEDGGVNDGHRLARRATRQMSSYLTRTWGSWSLRGEWKLVGDRYDDAANTIRLGAYGLVNLYADYRLERDWSVFVRANNVFNKAYETADQYATGGANVFLGVRYAPR